MRRWWFTMALVGSVGWCGGSGGPDAEPVDAALRIGSFDFAESELIAELYAQTLEATGLPVERLGVIGPREIVAPAAEQGRVDLVPEYLGTLAAYHGVEAGDLVDELGRRRLTLLDPAPAQDVNVLVVTEMFAAERELVWVSDLVPIADGLVIGGPVECPERPLCLAGLRDTYGLEFATFVPHRTLAMTAEALVRDEVQVGVMFSTAAELARGSFVVLGDDRGLQPAEHIVPLVGLDAVDRWGTGLTGPLDAVSSQLTTFDVGLMNRRVQDGESIPAVAAAWLDAHGLAAG